LKIFSVKPAEFAGGGFVCQDCDQPLKMSFYDRQNRDICPYWKKKKELDDKAGCSDESGELLTKFDDQNQDGFELKEGGADSSKCGSLYTDKPSDNKYWFLAGPLFNNKEMVTITLKETCVSSFQPFVLTMGNLV